MSLTEKVRLEQGLPGRAGISRPPGCRYLEGVFQAQGAGRAGPRSENVLVHSRKGRRPMWLE